MHGCLLLMYGMDADAWMLTPIILGCWWMDLVFRYKCLVAYAVCMDPMKECLIVNSNHFYACMIKFGSWLIDACVGMPLLMHGCSFQ